MIARTTGGNSSTSATAASETNRSRCIPGVGFIGGASDPTPFGLLMMRSFRADPQRPWIRRLAGHDVGVLAAEVGPLSMFGGHQTDYEEIVESSAAQPLMRDSQAERS